jgi:NADH-quinone oxidoreductase subunit N
MQSRWSLLMWIVAALSMTIGNLGALKQTNVKRMLAYSSIAHAGYLLAAFTAFPASAISAACFYTAAYAAMNVGAFAVVTQITGYTEHTRTLDDYAGVALRRPWLGGLLAFFLASLIGIPFTGGFFGKFYAFSAAIGGGHTLLAVVGLLNSGLACFYYLRLMLVMYSRHAEAGGNEPTRFTRVTLPAGLGLAAAALVTLVLGVLPQQVLNLANRGAAAVLAAPTIAGK